MDTNSRTHDNGGKLPVLLRLTPPSLEDTGAFRFEKNDNGIEKAFIGLPFKETAREIDLPLRNTATLEVDRFRTGEYFVYAIGLVEKDPLTLMRKHFSEVSRFIGVADRLPVQNRLIQHGKSRADFKACQYDGSVQRAWTRQG